ncbi:MAG TPA: hypothetical protein V6C98_01285 [Thermosynechococcaceae cyanobacterium]
MTRRSTRTFMVIQMQTSDAPENFQQQVLTELKQISQRLDRLETEVEKIDYKFDTYQKASDHLIKWCGLPPLLSSPLLLCSFSHQRSRHPGIYLW